MSHSAIPPRNPPDQNLCKLEAGPKPEMRLDPLGPALADKVRLLPPVRLGRLKCPPAEHQSPKELFRDACAMSEAGFTFEEQEEVLRLRFSGYYREITDREFENAITNASAAVIGGSPRRIRPKLPILNEKARALAIKGSPVASLADLKSRSEIANPGGIPTAEIIDWFFGPEELICMSTNKWDAVTRLRHEFAGVEGQRSFMVPNPMSERRGLTQQGALSFRCNANVGELRHLVIEFDHGTLDEQARLIGDLMSKNVPIPMVLFSGGKSLHSWVDLRGLNADQRALIRRYATSIGADPATFTPSQLVRTPNALRGQTGVKQEAIFLRSAITRPGKTQTP